MIGIALYLASALFLLWLTLILLPVLIWSSRSLLRAFLWLFSKPRAGTLDVVRVGVGIGFGLVLFSLLFLS